MLDAVDARSLRSAFLEIARLQPDAPALVLGGSVMCYGHIDHQARVIAACITNGGVERAERVAVFAYRSTGAYIGTLGALYSGAAFVPLNRKYPPDRTRAMLQRAVVDAILVDRLSASLLPAILSQLATVPRIIALESGVEEDLREHGIVTTSYDELLLCPPLVSLPPVQTDDIAYLLFTSGTTGEPKGVGISHANVLHYLDNMSKRYQLTPADRCSQSFEQTFDVSVFDIFMAWSAGATLYAMQPIELLAPVRFVQQHGLTVWFSVPSVVALAIRKGMLRLDSMPTLRYSFFAGEPLPDASAQAWHIAAPHSVIENLYGPTEATITCVGYRWDPDSSPAAAVNGIVPIGRPHAGLGALVVDDDLQPVGVGEAGELLICGPQIAPGYWRDSVKTAEKFVDIAVSTLRRKLFYRTGDRVIRSASGDYAYLGRVDNQIKVMGFRVELGEIEAVLLRDAGAVQAAAVGWPLEDSRALGIVAFVSGLTSSSEELTALVSARLPIYMVPKRVILLAEMPVNANGKIDRQQLLVGLDRGLF